MKTYLLCPFGDYDLNDKVFDSPYGILRDLLQQKDILLQTYDLGSIERADKILFLNHHEGFLQKCIAAGVRSENLILFQFEPEVVIPKQYRPENMQQYGKIFTYRDDWVDNKRFYKLRYPQGQSYFQELPPFKQRKFLTFINANKYSYVKNELYSFRRSAIRYFENVGSEFDVYGYGWNNNDILRLPHLVTALKSRKVGQYLRDVADGLRHYRSYRGTVNDKYETLSRYKFSLCFENEKNVQGWISEKIFDCFFTGTVPIYLGASNVERYIPQGCYIDMRKFSSFSELNRHILSMPELEWREIQSAGQEFIHSVAFDIWRPLGVFTDIVQVL
jgi:hypothetical protein